MGFIIELRTVAMPVPNMPQSLKLLFNENKLATVMKKLFLKILSHSILFWGSITGRRGIF